MSDTPSTASGLWVRKRDGASEPFQKAKLVSVLRAAMLAVGEGSATMAEELADAIENFITSSRPPGPLLTRHVAALLQRALSETGQAETAARLRDHERHRDYLRRQVRVLAWKASAGRLAPRRWNKSVLVHRLMKEQGLEATVARLVASRVEQIVLTLDLRQVTGGLVHELAASELLAWGLSPESLRVKAERVAPRS